MVVLADIENGGSGGIASEAEADVTYLGGEPTVHAFSPERVEQAERFEYRADESGVVFALVVSGEALKFPDLILTNARQLANTLNVDAAVDGVTGIAETQEVSDLGSVDDVFNVSVRSTSGLTAQIYTVSPMSMRPDVFAGLVKTWRKQLDAYEGR